MSAPRRRSPVNRVSRARGAATLLLFVVLAGCGLFTTAQQQTCPRVTLLEEVARVTQFRPSPVRDLTDMQFEGRIAGVGSRCKYGQTGLVDVTATIDMVFSRGPAADSEMGSFEYFVVITNPGEEIIAKRVFSLDVAFPAAATRVAAREELTQRFSYIPAANANLYRIYVGFQLTREQLDYERTLRR